MYIHIYTYIYIYNTYIHTHTHTAENSAADGHSIATQGGPGQVADQRADAGLLALRELGREGLWYEQDRRSNRFGLYLHRHLRLMHLLEAGRCCGSPPGGQAFASTRAPASEERMHLPAPAHQEQMQGVRVGEHLRKTSTCKECGGAGICQQCGGASICLHQQHMHGVWGPLPARTSAKGANARGAGGRAPARTNVGLRNGWMGRL